MHTNTNNRMQKKKKSSVDGTEITGIRKKKHTPATEKYTHTHMHTKKTHTCIQKKKRKHAGEK